jgi:hypothetical protein
MFNVNIVKCVDLPLQIGRPELDLGIGGFLSHSISVAYKSMELELESSYYLNVYYCNNPLTKNGVPYNPVKLTILDIKEVKDIFKSVYDGVQVQTYDHFCLGSLIHQFKAGEPITSKVLLDCAISNMVLESDLIDNIVENDYAKHVGTIDCLDYEGPREIGVTRNYVLNLSLVYLKASV